MVHAAPAPSLPMLCLLCQVKLEWSANPSLTVVLAAKGYPGSYAKGGAIRGLEGVTGAKVFHAGTAMKDGQVGCRGQGGRVWHPAGVCGCRRAVCCFCCTARAAPTGGLPRLRLRSGGRNCSKQFYALLLAEALT